MPGFRNALLRCTRPSIAVQQAPHGGGMPRPATRRANAPGVQRRRELHQRGASRRRHGWRAGPRTSFPGGVSARASQLAAGSTHVVSGGVAHLRLMGPDASAAVRAGSPASHTLPRVRHRPRSPDGPRAAKRLCPATPWPGRGNRRGSSARAVLLPPCRSVSEQIERLVQPRPTGSPVRG
jgi:hypothetical protein